MIKSRIFFSLIVVSLMSVGGCSQQQLKGFARDVAHNVGCEQRYEHQHKEGQLKGDCLRNRP